MKRYIPEPTPSPKHIGQTQKTWKDTVFLVPRSLACTGFVKMVRKINHRHTMFSRERAHFKKTKLEIFQGIRQATCMASTLSPHWAELPIHGYDKQMARPGTGGEICGPQGLTKEGRKLHVSGHLPKSLE